MELKDTSFSQTVAISPTLGLWKCGRWGGLVAMGMGHPWHLVTEAKKGSIFQCMGHSHTSNNQPAQGACRVPVEKPCTGAAGKIDKMLTVSLCGVVEGIFMSGGFSPSSSSWRIHNQSGWLVGQMTVSQSYMKIPSRSHILKVIDTVRPPKKCVLAVIKINN